MAFDDFATRTENADFIEYCYYRVWKAAGASDEHAKDVAYTVSFSDRAGKLTQGMGALENIDIALQFGTLDIEAVPEIISEGPTFAAIDGKKSSGPYVLNTMARLAVQKAKETGIAIVFGANHNDALGFGSYAWRAFREDMACLTSNSSPPLAAPFGGMENTLAVPPFDGIIPSGNQPPVWMSVKLAEFYDGELAAAAMQGKKMKGKWLIDPDTGKLTDDPNPYFMQLEGYGRVSDYTCAGQIENPRTYAQNLFNEGLATIINPAATWLSPETPRIRDYLEPQEKPSVGGSYFIAINPGFFGPIENVKEKADRYAEAIYNTKPRPGKSVRMPGVKGWKNLLQHSDTVQILENHWGPFWQTAERVGLSEEQLKKDYETTDWESSFK
jgi:LDH2 family malate/lactate/ureidoglycolate dehydrogenase